MVITMAKLRMVHASRLGQYCALHRNLALLRVCLATAHNSVIRQQVNVGPDWAGTKISTRACAMWRPFWIGQAETAVQVILGGRSHLLSHRLPL